ncbi:metallophosphoesterase family protein [Photobacterium alginatilyticum]|uniref:metallophosphoesterase family protein n=1 Tax=Photobacterium alginatilyticum TaxID=1775171 RepID=UPI0040696FFC
MATPSIILRFRDTYPGVDSIEAHRDLKEKKDSVLWGWWKKPHEDGFEQLFRELEESDCSGSVFIIDPSTKRCFIAEFIKAFRKGQSEFPIELVPEYYREHSEDVAAWFQLTSIKVTEYEPNMGKQIGNNTLLLRDTFQRLIADGPQITKKQSNKKSILHLSDLHFGSDHGFSVTDEVLRNGAAKSLSESLIKDLKRIDAIDDVASIIVTGDFTSKGDWSDATRSRILNELGLIANELGVTKDNIIAIPGNHDMTRYDNPSKIDPNRLASDSQITYEHELKYRIFVEDLTGRKWSEDLDYNTLVSLRHSDVYISVMNSCRIVSSNFTEYGFVGPVGLDNLDDLNSIETNRPTYKLMALHHHLIPVNRIEIPSENAISLTLDAVELLDKAGEVGVQLALHGHQHECRVTSYHSMNLETEDPKTPIIIVAAGSSGVDKNRMSPSMRNTYNLLTFDVHDVFLHTREILSDAKSGHTLFNKKLQITPMG